MDFHYFLAWSGHSVILLPRSMRIGHLFSSSQSFSWDVMLIFCSKQTNQPDAKFSIWKPTDFDNTSLCHLQTSQIDWQPPLMCGEGAGVSLSQSSSSPPSSPALNLRRRCPIVKLSRSNTMEFLPIVKLVWQGWLEGA